MRSLRTGALVLGLAAGLAGLLAGDAVPVGLSDRAGPTMREHSPATWREVKWPFPLDQWGLGRAYRCTAADCGTDIALYLRAKIGFCNCATGVADNADLDRVGDLELFSDKFIGLTDGRVIRVGPMMGLSRNYRVAIPYAAPRDMVSIGFNDKCDVAIATVVAETADLSGAEAFAIDFLNSDPILRWAASELGQP
jgi:hypothetical protein